MSQEFVYKLAFGMEKSGLPFIWVVRDCSLMEKQRGRVNAKPRVDKFSREES